MPHTLIISPQRESFGPQIFILLLN